MDALAEQLTTDCLRIIISKINKSTFEVTAYFRMHRKEFGSFGSLTEALSKADEIEANSNLPWNRVLIFGNFK